MNSPRVVVLGAGFGGLQAATSLSRQLGADVDVTLIDRNDAFVFGFSKLDVMFGKCTAAEVSHPYTHLSSLGVRFVRTTIRSIDPVSKRVETDSGRFDADFLVLALGADLDPGATPGLLDAGHEFYSPAGAFAARDVLAGFGGGRVVIGVTSTPFKCPPAPSETALLLHDYLHERGLREDSSIALVMPMPSPVPPVPAASEALLGAFTARGIEWHPQRVIKRIDAQASALIFDDDSTMPFDLFLGVPRHIVPPVVAESGMTRDGWVPVDPTTLRTSFDGVYAIGDVTSVGTPKAGIFAEGQAAVAAEAIASQISGGSAPPSYTGNGVCYVEFGDRRVARVDVTFNAGQTPYGRFDAASEQISTEKDAFGATRLRRWLGIG